MVAVPTMWSATLPAGPRGTIADVPGVTVGHCTLDAGAVQTGVTVVKPHPGDVYRSKVPAGAAVINGFGKSVGLVQVDELGTLDTPIALTNTFAVGAVAHAQIRAAIAANPRIGRDWSTVNPLVFECNDGYLNDIQAFAVTAAHYDAACRAASREVARGAVGAGRGMACFDLKGGIGSASRVAVAAGRPYTVGALVLANFGRLPMLTLGGVPVGRILAERQAAAAAQAAPPEQGSIILLLATDAPLDARQLSRLARRAGAGRAPPGSVFRHRSGAPWRAVPTPQPHAHQATPFPPPAL
ncbi:P1 family peptidase, partial [Burkholderia pseudomultivorans]|uniref:P1 family peptidase n=1 Tax=Burkholderia pseudomultivorans TaxID=1207504 RepID=UPI00287559D2